MNTHPEPASRAFVVILQARFQQHPNRHQGIDWDYVQGKLLANAAKLRSLHAMESKLDEFDTKTSSGIKTPADVRTLAGALFCDRHYGKVFIYRNGAQSYYAGRGFRASLRV